MTLELDATCICPKASPCPRKKLSGAIFCFHDTPHDCFPACSEPNVPVGCPDHCIELAGFVFVREEKELPTKSIIA